MLDQSQTLAALGAASSDDFTTAFGLRASAKAALAKALNFMWTVGWIHDEVFCLKNGGSNWARTSDLIDVNDAL